MIQETVKEWAGAMLHIVTQETSAQGDVWVRDLDEVEGQVMMIFGETF